MCFLNLEQVIEYNLKLHFNGIKKNFKLLIKNLIKLNYFEKTSFSPAKLIFFVFNSICFGSGLMWILDVGAKITFSLNLSSSFNLKFLIF